MNKNSAVFVIILLFVGVLTIAHETQYSITAYATPDKYPGDSIGISFAESTILECPQYKQWRVEMKVIGEYGYSSSVSGSKTSWSYLSSGPLTKYTMISDSGTYTATKTGIFTAMGRVVCSNGDILTQGDTSQGGWSTFSFTVYEKPDDVTCTNECTVLGSRDRTYKTCDPYKLCGNYDSDPCLEWKLFSQPSCTPDDPPVTCQSDWSTGEWSPCADSLQTRQVSDLNNCNVPTGTMPVAMRECETPPYIPPDNGDDDTGGDDTSTDWNAYCISKGYDSYDAIAHKCIGTADDDSTDDNGQDTNWDEYCTSRGYDSYNEDTHKCTGGSIFDEDSDSSKNLLLYAGIGALFLIFMAIMVIIAMKKK